MGRRCCTHPTESRQQESFHNAHWTIEVGRQLGEQQCALFKSRGHQFLSVGSPAGHLDADGGPPLPVQTWITACGFFKPPSTAESPMTVPLYIGPSKVSSVPMMHYKNAASKDPEHGSLLSQQLSCKEQRSQLTEVDVTSPVDIHAVPISCN
eukprot:COSAG02_NODE_1952_length_10284_cov_6.837997_7_plen_152_part_00